MKLIPIDRQNISILIFCLYKSTHINSFRNMNADNLEKQSTGLDRRCH